MGGGSGGSKSQTTKTEPWSGQQPYLKDIFRQAQDIYRQGYGQQYYPGQQVAAFSPQTQMGLNQMTQYGMGPTPYQQGAQGFVNQATRSPFAMMGLGQDYVGGPVSPGGGFGESTQPGYAGAPTPYFSGNPQLDAMVNRSISRAGEGIREQVMPGIAATFGGAGRTGGGIQQQMMENVGRDFGREAEGIASDIYGRAYETGMERDLERRRLAGELGMRGAAMAPQMQQMDLTQMQQMMKAGALTEDQAQRMIDAQQRQFDFYQQAPYAALGQYSNIVGGMPTGMGTTTGPGRQQGSRLSGAMGGAMAGMATGNPYMALAGGALGAFGM